MGSLVLLASSEVDTPISSITLRLFGPTLISLNGAPLRFPYDHVLALLVYLACPCLPLNPIEAIAGLLWPEQPEHAAR